MPEDVITETQAEGQQSAYPAEASREMINAGVFYGRKKNKTNPKMKQFVLANRGGIEIINLQKTEEAMAAAEGFVTEKIKQGGNPLFVGAVPAGERMLTEVAKKHNFPFVTARWVGGTITNYHNIAKRISYMKKLREDFAANAFEKYTKKERLEKERELEKLEALIGGLENMTREPDFLIVIDPALHETAVHEAVTKNIPIVAFANVDANPDVITRIVPGNDRAKLSIEWFLEKIDAAIQKGLAERAMVAAQKEAAAKEEAAQKEKAAAARESQNEAEVK